MAEPIKILIVDDDPGIRLALHDFLAQNGFTDVTAAANGHDDLVYLRSNTPQLIISDITMPQMDGYALVQALHQDTRLKSVPVIILTGRGEMAELLRLVEVYNFLIKPVEPRALLEMIRKVLGKGEYAQDPGAEHFMTKIEKIEDILTKKKPRDPSLEDSLDQLKKMIKKQQ